MVYTSWLGDLHKVGPCINDVRTEGSPIELIVLVGCMSVLVTGGGGSNIQKILQKSLNYGPVWKGRFFHDNQTSYADRNKAKLCFNLKIESNKVYVKLCLIRLKTHDSSLSLSISVVIGGFVVMTASHVEVQIL